MEKKQKKKVEESPKSSGISFATFLLALVLSLAMFAHQKIQPPTLKVHSPFKYHVLENIWDAETSKSLMEMVRNVKTYRTVVEDLTSKIEEIGEGRPLKANGECPHPYLVPNPNKTMCIFPSRIDVAKHFLLTGGITGHREKYETLVSRMLPFGGYLFDKLQSPELQQLFSSKVYLERATDVCEGKSHFDPIQLSILINLPGQETPMHWDVPWFFGASRFTFPQWLVVVMENSGLWEHLRVPQVQGVAYIHRWSNESRGGNFFFYPEGPGGRMESIPPVFNTGIVLDGARLVHGVDTYTPSAKPAPIKKHDKNELTYEGNDEWKLSANGKEIRIYKTEELRIALVWRVRCFSSEEEKKKWDEFPPLQLEEVLDTLVNDLKKRGRISDEVPKGLDLALMLLNEYARMPYPEKLFPYNYCMLSSFLPEWAKPALDLVC